MRVLEGLPGIKEIEMRLEQDAFTIEFDPSRISEAAIGSCVRMLGYRPQRIEPKLPASAETGSDSSAAERGPLPDVVTSALAEAKKTGRHLLLEFYAGWCAPCQKLERDMERADVREVFGNYAMLRIDTDENPDVATHFGVIALPTLIVLDTGGRAVFRSVGLIEPDELVRDLSSIIGGERIK